MLPSDGRLVAGFAGDAAFGCDLAASESFLRKACCDFARVVSPAFVQMDPRSRGGL